MHKNIFRGIMNRILHLVAQFGPGAESFRPWIHKLRGVKIHGRAFIGDQVYIENEFPECVEMMPRVQIGPRATIIAHYRGPGKVVFEEDSWVGTGVIIAAPVGVTITIGRQSVVAAGAVITRDVPPCTMVAGVPAKPIAKVTVPWAFGASYEEQKAGLEKI